RGVATRIAASSLALAQDPVSGIAAQLEQHVLGARDSREIALEPLDILSLNSAPRLLRRRPSGCKIAVEPETVDEDFHDRSHLGHDPRRRLTGGGPYPDDDLEQRGCSTQRS